MFNVVEPLARTAETVTLRRPDYEAMVTLLASLIWPESGPDQRLPVQVATLPLSLAERAQKGESPLLLWRQHRDLTEHAVAAVAGISVFHLLKLESGELQASEATLSKIADALCVSMAALR